MRPASSPIQLYVSDFLGSSRVVTTSTGAVCYDADFTPFGAERAYTNSCATANNYKFEGKERDAETQNDDFGARYYTWRFGRWLSADWSNVPAPVPYANLTNPQTLNLYAMVADDPESFADLDGHQNPDGSHACNAGRGEVCVGSGEKTIQPADGTVVTVSAPFAKVSKQTDGAIGVSAKAGLFEGKVEKTSDGLVNPTNGNITDGKVNGTVSAEGGTVEASARVTSTKDAAQIKLGVGATVARAGGSLDFSAMGLKLHVGGSYVAGWAATASGQAALPPGAGLALPRSVGGSIKAAAGILGAALELRLSW